MRRFVMTCLMLLAAVSLEATVVVPADLRELSRDARAIARGQVVAVDAQWTGDRRTIETIVTLRAEEYLKGQLGDTVQFRVPGGTLGRFRRVVIGAPRLEIGQHIIVFLGASGPAIPFVLGFNQGLYRIASDARGSLLVTPPPVLPGPTGPIVRGSAARVPAPLADFERTVRSLVAGGQ
jgi:hypothetical protein